MDVISTELPLPKLEPEYEPSPLEIVINKIKQNSQEIDKYFLFSKTGELVVKADIEEKEKTGKTSYFQVQYDIKNIKKESSGEYLIAFTLTNTVTKEIYEDKFLWEPQKDNSGILLSFDDHYINNWESYFNFFDRYNAKATFFVTGTYNRNSNFSRRALRRWHDIGYHSLNHFNLPLLSRQRYNIQTRSQVNNFRKAKIPLVSFAYPYGSYASWMNNDLLRTYKLLRGFNISFQAYDKQAIKEGFILSRSIDNIYFKQDRDFIRTVDLMLRTVKFTGRDFVLPLSSHIISNKADWGIKPHRLEYIFKTANELQLNFYCYRDFF
jgi:peptidoglycan/xylan/chitin deacetylase (PgdA/CDA1 family)